MPSFSLAIAVLGGILLIGLPVAFGLGGTALILAAFQDAISLNFLNITILEAFNSFTLLAIPLFVLMSQVLLTGKVGDSIFDAINSWVGHLPGGLAVATVFSCAIFASITGSGAATVATIGMVAYPAMFKRGYDKKFTCGLLATGGVLGILIPPSIPMILYSSITDCSLDKLFMAGIIPGILLTFLLAGYAVFRSLRGEYTPVPKAGWPERWRLTRHNLPAMTLPVVVIGGIYSGVFTPTEAAAVGLVYSLLLTSFVYKTLRWKHMPAICLDSLTTSCMIGMIIMGAHLFGKVLTLMQIPQELTRMVVENNLSPMLFILAINVLLLVLGALLETVSCILLTTPLILPIMQSLAIDPIWYGVVLTVNMTIALITPPVGMDLYVIKSLRDDISFNDVIEGVAPFIALLLLFLVIIILFPGISTFLPSLMPARGSV
ncbi:C4-dicarboxylate ABC transporter permease [Deltaproteobacteria bacterium]|nr:C4-dicarboxylate ABC transporter permease [Deltaproteobacteria bacterium]